MLNLARVYKALMIAGVSGSTVCALLSYGASGIASGVEETYAPVLAPEQFGGEASMGYAAAAAEPKICAKLFCYCGCDSTDNHTNLLDCFTSTHGSDCHICQEEALMALRMQKDGKNLKEIQKSVDDTYSHMYPFKNPTAALKNYRAHKLYVGEPVDMHGPHSAADNTQYVATLGCCAKSKKENSVKSYGDTRFLQ